MGLLRVAAYAARVSAARLRHARRTIRARRRARWAPCRCMRCARANSRSPTRASPATRASPTAAWAWPTDRRRARCEPIRAFGTMLETGSMSDVTSNSYVQMMPHTTRGQRQPVLGSEGAHHPDVLRVRVGQPGDRLRVRGDRDRQADADARGRRGRTVGAGGRGVRHAVRDQHAQRRAASHAASVRCRARRPRGRRRRGDAGARRIRARDGARRAHSRGDRRLRLQLGRRAHHPADRRRRWRARCSSRSTTRGLHPDAIAYVNAHGTATDRGDVAESHATAQTFGERMPISSLKSYIGHTLGACGALEAWWTIEMMKRNWYAPTLNLDRASIRPARRSTTSSARGARDRRRIRDEQQLRVRRHQHVADFQARSMSAARLQRVVVTGMGIVSCLGNTLDDVSAALARGPLAASTRVDAWRERGFARRWRAWRRSRRSRRSIASSNASWATRRALRATPRARRSTMPDSIRAHVALAARGRGDRLGRRRAVGLRRGARDGARARRRQGAALHGAAGDEQHRVGERRAAVRHRRRQLFAVVGVHDIRARDRPGDAVDPDRPPARSCWRAAARRCTTT